MIKRSDFFSEKIVSLAYTCKPQSMLEERTGTPGQNPEAGTMERGSWLVPACPAFLYSPGSLAHGMVLPTVIWTLLQQLPIKANPHRCVHRPLWSGQFLHQGFSSQRTFSCVKLSILIMYYLCSWWQKQFKEGKSFESCQTDKLSETCEFCLPLEP